LRSKIRIDDARAKPIDLLARYINEEDDFIVDMREPYTYLNGLTIRDLEDLLVDIRVYTDLEPNKNTQYWNDMVLVTQDELKKLQKMDKNSKGIIESIFIFLNFKQKSFLKTMEPIDPKVLINRWFKM
jgi:hypothetical protein